MPSEVPASDFQRLPEDLPPVQPPSAGFIAQLFLIPGIIVLGIVLVWLGISRLASNEQDWRALVTDIQSPQEHIRSRAIFGLAQQLLSEQAVTHTGPKLRDNAQVAQQLSDTLEKELKHTAPSEDTIKQQAILARTLGLFNVADVVLPALAKATGSQHDLEVRKNALGSIAILAGRAHEAKQPLNQDLVLPAVLEASADSTALVRQLSAFALGLLPGDQAKQRLSVLVEDSSDINTRLNAAIALVRQGSKAGVPVFEEVLKNAVEKPSAVASDAEFSEFTQVKNALHGLELLAPQLTAEEKQSLIKYLTPMSKTYREPRLRRQVQALLRAFAGDLARC